MSRVLDLAKTIGKLMLLAVAWMGYQSLNDFMAQWRVPSVIYFYSVLVYVLAVSLLFRRLFPGVANFFGPKRRYSSMGELEGKSLEKATFSTERKSHLPNLPK